MEPFQRLIIPISISDTIFNLKEDTEMFDLSEIEDFNKFYHNLVRNLNNTEIFRAFGDIDTSALFERVSISKKQTVYMPKKGTAAEIICQTICDNYNSQIIGMKGLFQKKMQLCDAYEEAKKIIENMKYDPNYRVTYEKEESNPYGRSMYFKFIYEPQTASTRSWLAPKIRHHILFQKLEGIKYVEVDLNYIFKYGKEHWVIGNAATKETRMQELFKYIEELRDLYQRENIPYIEIGDKRSPYVKKIFSDKDPVLFKNYKEVKDFMKLSERKQDEFVEKRIEDTEDFFKELDNLGIDLF